MTKTPDTPRPVPPHQQTPDRGPIDPKHEPAKGDGEPGELENDDGLDAESKRLEEEQKQINKQKTVE